MDSFNPGAPAPGARKPAASLPVALIIFLVLALIGAGGWFLYSRMQREPPQAPVLTTDAREYVRANHLRLSDVQMGAKESFAKQMLVEITGNIMNAGDRPVKLVEINCVFRDPYGQVVLRERRAIVGARAGSLKPGETKTFRMAFDNLPEGWNQAMPELVIAQIVFG